MRRFFYPPATRWTTSPTPLRLRNTLPRARRLQRQAPVAIFRADIHIPGVLMPPLVFAGLFVTLWCWKCAMLIIFQNVIIYNPFLPPDSRRMRISDVASQCGQVQWREERIKSLDGTEIALCVSDVAALDDRNSSNPATVVYLLYFQGNAGSIPSRLPDLSWVLRRLHDANKQVHYTTICVSYRGYWTSQDRPSERGINQDCEAALQWVSQLHRSRSANKQDDTPILILWGQSVGCGFATNLAAQTDDSSNLPVDALLLETPFTSTRAMLKALYPQKWLPYQYLWPFLRNHLDSLASFRIISDKRKNGVMPTVYIVQAGKDELVPADHGESLHRECEALGLPVERQIIPKALHNDVTVRQAGKQALAMSILRAVDASHNRNAVR